MEHINNIFIIDNYTDDGVAMICDNECDARSFELYLHSLGRKWCTESSYAFFSKADDHIGEMIAYFFNKGTYSDSYSMEEAISSGKALYYSDFDWENSCDDAQISIEDIENLICSTAE